MTRKTQKYSVILDRGTTHIIAPRDASDKQTGPGCSQDELRRAPSCPLRIDRPDTCCWSVYDQHSTPRPPQCSRSAMAEPSRMLALLWLSLLFLARQSALWAFPFGPSLDVDVTPRTTVYSKGVLGRQRFTGSVQNYSTLLLDEGAGLLYVGGRGAIYALDTANISAPANATIDWEASAEQKKQCLNKGKDNQTECYNHIRFLEHYNSTHLYVCGTHAFRPLCAYIDTEHFNFSSGLEEGRDRCPYDPAKGFTGLLIEGEMFTASQYEFRSSPDVRRNFPLPALRTEEAPTRWLLEADFVGSALLKEHVTAPSATTTRSTSSSRSEARSSRPTPARPGWPAWPASV
ncbi:unnamed protein product, partial [Gadus morhua 'NCC']